MSGTILNKPKVLVEELVGYEQPQTSASDYFSPEYEDSLEVSSQVARAIFSQALTEIVVFGDRKDSIEQAEEDFKGYLEDIAIGMNKEINPMNVYAS